MRTRERRNGINNVVVLMAACVLFFALFAHQMTTRALFVPGPASYGEDESFIRIESGDGVELAAFWGPAEGARWTVLYAHGNSEDLGDVRRALENYRLQGVSVLAFDYRGYGRSEGQPSETNSYEDAEAVYRYATDELGVDGQRIILHGRALGGGVAMQLATQVEPAALILESAFLSVYKLYLPLKWLPGDKFDNERKAPLVQCPTLVIHGKADQVVPFEHGEKLAGLMGSAAVKTLWLDGAGHEELAAGSGAEYWAGIRGFLASLDPAGL